MTTPTVFFAFCDPSPLATSTAAALDLEVRPISVHRFPDGESLVRAECEPGCRAIVFCSLDHPNQKLIELLLVADAIRRQGPAEIVLVAPYLGYMRQDRIFQRGEPISQRVVAGLLGSAFDAVLTVEAHLHRIRRLSEVFPCRAESFSAAPTIAAWLREQESADLLVGPDSESEPWIRSIAERAQRPFVVGAKRRYADRHVEIELPEIPDGIQSAWIIDDIASSGATLETMAQILKSRGVRRVGAIIVHALVTEAALERFAEIDLDPLVSTDSIPHATNAISLAPMLAELLDSAARRSEAS